MAGGMTPGGRERLAQWVAVTRARQAGRTDVTALPIRHCWYDSPHGRQAALLLEWRNTGGHYDGRIAVVAFEPDGWGIVEMW